MEFRTVMDAENLTPKVKSHIESLLKRKISGQEFSEEPRLDALNEYIENRISHFKAIVQDYDPGNKPLPEYRNEFFSHYLQNYDISH